MSIAGTHHLTVILNLLLLHCHIGAYTCVRESMINYCFDQ